MKTEVQGFTLVELVVSLAIFLIVVVGAALTISTILSTHNRDLERTTALTMGKEKAIELHHSGVYQQYVNNEEEEQRYTLSDRPLLEYSIETLYVESPYHPYPIKETMYIRNILVIHYSGGRIKFDF